MTQLASHRAYIYAFFMSIVGATAAAALKYIGAGVAVEFITLWQYLICLLISLVILRFKKIGLKQVLAIESKDRFTLFVRGISGLLGFYAFYAAINNIPLVDATLLRHSSPLFVPLIAWLWFALKTPVKTLAFIVLGFVGVYITLRPDAESASFYHIVGLLAGICLAFSMVTTNRLKSYDSSIVLFYYFLISFIGILPAGINTWQSVSLLEAVLIFYIGSSIYIALYLYNKAFTLSSAALVSPMTYLSIVHAGVLGWLIWGYVPSLISVLGMLIVVVCGLLTTLQKN